MKAPKSNIKGEIVEIETVATVDRPLVRYCPPTKLDSAPMNTVVRVMTDEGSVLYIQSNDIKDDLFDEPEWVRMGIFLEHVFSEFTTDAEFLKECMVIYQYKQDRKFLKVSNIIKDRMG